MKYCVKFGLRTPKMNKLLLYFFSPKLILYKFNYFVSLYIRDGANNHATGSNGFI